MATDYAFKNTFKRSGKALTFFKLNKSKFRARNRKNTRQITQTKTTKTLSPYRPEKSVERNEKNT